MAIANMISYFFTYHLLIKDVIIIGVCCGAVQGIKA